jgi:hypothetical protein
LFARRICNPRAACLDHPEIAVHFIVQDKIWLARVLNVSDKALHVVVGVALYFLFLKLLKSPGRAVLAVLGVELANEINDAVVAYPYLTHAFWFDTSTDILATMVLPCLIAGWRMFRCGGLPD